MKFEEAIEDDSVFHKHVKYIQEMENTTEKVRYLLTNIKFLRNFPNKDFVFAYWVFCDGLIIGKPLTKEGIRRLTDSEVIRRSKQKLVELNAEVYGPLSDEVLAEKQEKQAGIMEFVIS